MSRELPEVKCITCDAIFTVIYNRSIDTEGGIQYCPFCGDEWERCDPHPYLSVGPFPRFQDVIDAALEKERERK